METKSRESSTSDRLSRKMILTSAHAYSLRAVLEHNGESSGHYVSYVRCLQDIWYLCDDRMQPKAGSPATVLQVHAYMFVYERA